MTTISLAEAVKLKSLLNKRVHELEMELDRVAFVEIEKGTKIPEKKRTVKIVEEELEELRKDMRMIDRLMYQANATNYIEHDGEQYLIVEAIELATQLRAKARKYKMLGEAEKESFSYSYSDTNKIVRIALFEPEEYRVKGLEVEKAANRLSNAINAKNYAIELPFDGSKYF